MTLFSLFFAGLACGMNVDSLTAALRVETGMAFLEQGLPQRALIEFTSALEASETADEAYLGLGRAYALSGSWETAEENYLAFMALEPFDHRPAIELAEMLLDLPGRLEDASMYAEMALALSPLDGRCRLASADAAAAQGETEGAVSRYNLVIGENPEFASDARIRLGLLLFSQGDLNGAREVLMPAAEDGKAEAHRLLCLVYLDQSDDLRASDCAQRYLYLEPNGSWADSARIIVEEVSFQSSPGNPGE